MSEVPGQDADLVVRRRLGRPCAGISEVPDDEASLVGGRPTCDPPQQRDGQAEEQEEAETSTKSVVAVIGLAGHGAVGPPLGIAWSVGNMSDPRTVDQGTEDTGP